MKVDGLDGRSNSVEGVIKGGERVRVRVRVSERNLVKKKRERKREITVARVVALLRC